MEEGYDQLRWWKKLNLVGQQSKISYQAISFFQAMVYESQKISENKSLVWFKDGRTW